MTERNVILSNLNPHHVSPTPEGCEAIRASVAEDSDSFLADAEWFRDAESVTKTPREI